MRQTIVSILFAVAVAACGGKSQPAPEAGGGNERLAEGAEVEEKHPELTPELHAFHETLAPLWHAEAGPEREPGACAGTDKLTADAAAVAAAGAPEGVEPNDWASAVTGLQASVQELAEGCKAGDSAGFETRFTAVHDGFHGLMELLQTRGPAV
jgi:hypothetical protein